jgi:DNA-binding NtrC family response regulator
MRQTFYPKFLREPVSPGARSPQIGAGDVLAHLPSGNANGKEVPVQLVADRFMMMTSEMAVDLATGDRVILRASVGGGAAEQARWANRCQTFHTRYHPALAALVDYGSLGETQRFEAWACGAVWSGGRRTGERASGAVTRLLQSCGLTSSPDQELRERFGRAAVLPGDAAGYVAESCEARDLCPPAPDEFALARIERPADRVFADLFSSLAGSRPHIVNVWGPPGSGRTRTVLGAARCARAAGFIPVAVHVIDTVPADLLAGRSLCLIDDGDGDTRWRCLLKAVLASPRGHVVIRTCSEAIRSRHGIGLELFSAATLSAAVRPQPSSLCARRHVHDAARRARGLPARFAELLWGGSVYRPPTTPSRGVGGMTRVAEHRAVYGRQEPPSRDAPGGGRVSWPVSADLAALREQAALAGGRLRAGRFALGERQLRQAVHALARRHDWASAAEHAVVLASALVIRGLPRQGQDVLEDAKEFATRAEDTARLLDVAVCAGHAWIDRARLERAEAVLGAALAASQRVDDPFRRVSASLALARCLFWQGRYAECSSVLSHLGECAEDQKLERAILESRAAVGAGVCARAMAAVREAGEIARHLDTPAATARASCAAAFVHLAVHDLAAARVGCRSAIASARLAREPMRGLRAWLLFAEAERRDGRGPAALRVVDRILSVRGDRVPEILRAQAELLRALCRRPAGDQECAERVIRRSGLDALALYAPNHRFGSDGATSHGSTADALVAILQVCQSAADESTVLKSVCASLRSQLRASFVVTLLADTGRLTDVAYDGLRAEIRLAETSLESAHAVGPRDTGEWLEAAAPIRYADATLGVLAARWPLGTAHDLGQASAVLTMAATAVAPVVSALAAGLRESAAPASGPLLGVSAAMAALRRTIAAAAHAPFGVLVEGESGTGKELVAREVHRLGSRRARPFCALNCAALPDDLVEAELFGHVRGAYTGAVAERAGVFEEAHGGTLFLDEVGELALRAQAKLLRVCQEGELRRLGENVSRRVDVRLVCATNRNLRQEVDAGRFRLDLLYRLDIIRIDIPPLRERREDIGVLLDHFWQVATERVGSHAALSEATRVALIRYDWPGNVRELQNALAALAVRAPRRGVVPLSALPAQFAGAPPPETWRLDGARRAFEERFVRATLVRCGGRRSRAASELGVSRQGLTKLMARLGIDTERTEVDRPSRVRGALAPVGAFVAEAKLDAGHPRGGI